MAALGWLDCLFPRTFFSTYLFLFVFICLGYLGYHVGVRRSFVDKGGYAVSILCSHVHGFWPGIIIGMGLGLGLLGFIYIMEVGMGSLILISFFFLVCLLTC